MSLPAFLLLFIIIGFVLWLINTYIPMQPPFKTVMNVVVILSLIGWLLSVFGLIPHSVVRL